MYTTGNYQVQNMNTKTRTELTNSTLKHFLYDTNYVEDNMEPAWEIYLGHACSILALC